MCFVLQIINFLSHNTLLKNKNNRAYLKFVLAKFHTIFYKAAVLKNIFYWTKYHSFHAGYQNEDDSLTYTGILLFYK